MNCSEKGSDNLNALLRGEIAATETYQQAIEKMSDSPSVGGLRRMHEEHREAANLLRQHVRECGGEPDQSSGAWGTWASLVEGTAKLFGQSAALKALKEGEEQGIHDYEEALEDPNLATESRTFIQSTLLPRTREHVATLDQMMAS